MAKPIHPREIPGIDPGAVELLEAVGYADVQLLPSLDPGDLHREILQANEMLQLAERDVSFEEVERWLREAAEMTGRSLAEEEAASPQNGGIDGVRGRTSAAGEDPDQPTAVDYEQSPQVQSMLAVAPYALPLPARILMDHQVGVSSIPAGILLTHFTGDLEVRVNPNPTELPPPGGNMYASRISGEDSGPQIDVPRIRTTEEVAGTARPQSLEPDGDESPHALIRAPRAATNRGKDPGSRRYIRGLLHTEPVKVYLGALATFLVFFLVPASVICAVLLVLSSELPGSFQWVPSQLLWVPALLVVVGLFYALFAVGSRCRVCNQRLFIYGSYHKNDRAHRLPGMGYVLPLSLHLLIFRWFRCTHCGTPMRVKK